MPGNSKAKSDWVIRLGRRRPATYAVVYFLLIPIFGTIFAFAPGVSLDCGENSCGAFQALYLSVVTITTLGYGDVTPSDSAAQAAAAIEALLGVITIGLFLNSLSYAISRDAQQAEAKAQKRIQILTAQSRLRSFDSIVQLYAARFKLYAYLLVTPMANRGNPSAAMAADFAFKDMKDLFEPTLLLADDFNHSTVWHFLNAQDDLQGAIREFMQGVDLSEMPALALVCHTFMKSCTELNWRGAILAWEAQPKTPGGGTKMLQKMIADTEGEPTMQPSNAINAFVTLYQMTKQNLRLLQQYDVEIAKALLPPSEDKVCV
jgi:hypothetical protein